MDKIQKRFWAKVDKSGKCWTWTAASNSKGYGRFKIQGKYHLPHRLVYEWIFGDIPDGYDVCHHCDNPSCVNPDHLFVGTRSDNMKDAVSKNRLPSNMSYLRQYIMRGEDHPCSKLTERDVLEIRHLIATRQKTQRQIAAMFSVNQSTIRDIALRRKWKHI